MTHPPHPLAGRRIAILATDGVEQIELTHPRSALVAAGAEVLLLAPRGGTIQAMNHLDRGDRFPVDFAIADRDPDEFDAVYLPGGVFNADQLRVVAEAQAFVRAIDRARKPIAVICHGPWLLVSAGLVRGRTLTSYPTLRDDIVNAGGQWIDQPVVVEGNWISSRRPADLRDFEPRMVERFHQPVPVPVR